MGWSFQQAPTGKSSGNTASLAGNAFASNNLANSLLFCITQSYLAAGGPPAVSSITDTPGNSWTINVITQVDAGNNLLIAGHYCKAAIAGANTITVNFASMPDVCAIAYGEWSGGDNSSPYLTGTSGTNSASNNPSSGSITPSGSSTGDSEVLYLGGLLWGTNGNAVTPGQTEREKFDDGNGRLEIEEFIGSGAKSMTWTLASNDDWVALVMSFRAAPIFRKTLSPIGTRTFVRQTHRMGTL